MTSRGLSQACESGYCFFVTVFFKMSAALVYSVN